VSKASDLVGIADARSVNATESAGVSHSGGDPVANILGKLGVENRRAAVAIATRYGLL